MTAIGGHGILRGGMDLFEFASSQQEADKAHYEALCATVRHNNELYYAQAQPMLSDAEYDRLYREIETIEAAHPDWITPDSPTQRVGNDLNEGFAKVKHPAPMQSIDDIFEHNPGDGALPVDEELIEFYQRLKRSLTQDSPKVVVEPKIDGCAVTLMYRQGKLAYAATRGDGHTGDDITDNVRTIRSVPTRLPAGAPEVLEVRGEIYMPWADFNRMNEERDADGLPAFANPRNATAGTIKLLDAAEVAQRPLRFLAHGLGLCEGAELHNMDDYEALLQTMKIPYNQPIIRAASLEELRQAVADINTQRQKLGFGTDGAVIKLDDFALRDQLGSTARAPRWAAAYKYLPEQKETVLHGISVQVGRSGVLTPVAELEPVFLSGSTVSRATLHNQGEITKKDIRIGDTVLVEKSGEIIPNIVHVILGKRPSDTHPYDLFQAVGGVCPSCGHPIRREGQVAWCCSNITCPGQAIMKTAYFCKREALDIEALGETVAEVLVKQGMIRHPLDLFSLSQEQLASLNLGTEKEPRRFGEKNAARIIEALNKARSMPMERWLMALGIPQIGATTARTVARFFPRLSALQDSDYLGTLVRLHEYVEAYNALSEKRACYKEQKTQDPGLADRLRNQQDALRPTIDQLLQRPYGRIGYLKVDLKPSRLSYDFRNPIGDAATAQLHRYFQSEIGRATLALMQQLGIDPASETYREDWNDAPTREGPLAGLTLVLTGALSRPRPEMETMIQSAGGKATNSVTKKTNYLVAGEGGGSKRDKAAKLHIPIISEEELLALIKGEVAHG